MRLELVLDGETLPWRPTPEWESLAREITAQVGPSDGAVEFVLTDDATVHELNADYRGKDRSTDVLSFSYLEDHAGSRHRLLDGSVPAADFCGDPVVDDEVLVGQVLVSVEFVLARGARDDRSVPGEMLFLLIHGLLHVLGFDHVEDDEAEEMEAHETRLYSLARSRVGHGGGAA